MHTEHIHNILGDLEKKFDEMKQTGMNYIVGISGIDGAGKSTLSKQLCEKLHERGINAYTVHGDDFLFERKVRNANPDQAIAYYYETFDYNKLFNEIIVPLKEEKEFYKVVELLDWESDTFYTKEFKIKAPCIILVEGVLLFKKQIAHVFDYNIWIDIDFEVGLSRALRRERDIHYYKDKEEIENRYLNRFYAGQKLHFEYDEPNKSYNYIVRE